MFAKIPQTLARQRFTPPKSTFLTYRFVSWICNFGCNDFSVYYAIVNFGRKFLTSDLLQTIFLFSPASLSRGA